MLLLVEWGLHQAICSLWKGLWFRDVWGWIQKGWDRISWRPLEKHELCLWLATGMPTTYKSKAVPLSSCRQQVGENGIAPTHSWPRH